MFQGKLPLGCVSGVCSPQNRMAKSRYNLLLFRNKNFRIYFSLCLILFLCAIACVLSSITCLQPSVLIQPERNKAEWKSFSHLGYVRNGDLFLWLHFSHGTNCSRPFFTPPKCEKAVTQGPISFGSTGTLATYWTVFSATFCMAFDNHQIKVAGNSFQYFPRLRVWWIIITTLYRLMPKSWYQQTAQSSVNKLLSTLWHNRLP